MLSGNAGHSSGPHLHFGIRPNGVKRSPEPVLAALLRGAGVSAVDGLPTGSCMSYPTEDSTGYEDRREGPPPDYADVPADGVATEARRCVPTAPCLFGRIAERVS